MTNSSNLIGVRCSEKELEAIDRLVAQRQCSRNEAVRIAIRAGADLALLGHTIDLRRVLLLLEYTQAAVDVIVHREHSDAAPQLEAITQQRMEKYHAPR